MNALVKKEIRLLLPGFVAGLLAVGAIWLLPPDRGFIFDPNTNECSLLFCSVLMMTLGVFGREFSSGTFSMLLAQPVPRMRIWRIKTLLLAVMVTLVWGLWYVFWIHHHLQYFADPRNMGISTMLFALAMYSGGLWSVLLFQQVTAAFWFTILTPAALWMSIENLLDHQPRMVVDRALAAVFILYGIVGFLFARWLFIRAQDAQWTGGHIRLPEIRGLARFKTGSGALRKWRPRAALLMKELQLHQAQFIMAGVLALLHLGVIAMRKSGKFPEGSLVGGALELFWLFWMLMPLLVGCAAVAEERKIGTLEGQLCLPAKQRTQFALKFLVMFVLSILLGMGMPLLLEGMRILPHYDMDSYTYNQTRDFFMIAEGGGRPGVCTQFAVSILTMIFSCLPLLIVVAINTVTACVAFYASTLVRNTLQALAPAVFGILLTWFLLVAAYLPEDFIRYSPWRGPLIYFIAVPTMAVVMILLAYWNYKRTRPGWHALRKNLLSVTGALLAVGLCTTAIYNRTWELLAPIEPPHGTVRLVPNLARLQVSRLGITVLLPDGRAWLDPDYFLAAHAFGNGKFLDGTNWRDVVVGEYDIAGIQRDGSLWVSEKSIQPIERLRARLGQKRIMDVSDFTKLIRMGNENDWKSIHAYTSQGQFLLKNDGTLWLWGRPSSIKKWPGLRSFTPQQLGTDADWEKIFDTNGRTYFRKTNGMVWVLGRENSDYGLRMTLNDYIDLSHDPEMEGEKLKSVVWCSTRQGMFRAGVGDDGIFRELPHRQDMPITRVDREIKIGSETHWRTVVGGDLDWVVSLKADGTLWRWNFRTAPDINPQGFSVTRFGEHSDWVGIDGASYREFISLAADGSLWRWRPEPEWYDKSQGLNLLLANSRKPQYLGNIFNDGH